jgi:outer membrane protein
MSNKITSSIRRVGTAHHSFANKNGVQCTPYLVCLVIPIMALILLISGCDFYFNEERYETVKVSPERLQEIEALDLKEVSQEDSPKDTDDPAVEIAPEKLAMTVQESRALALENNLGLKVSLFSPTIANQSITEARAAFEPLAFSQLNFVKSDTPEGEPITFTLDSSQSEYIQTDVGFQLPLRTGGSVTLDMPINRIETDFPRARVVRDDQGNIVVDGEGNPVFETFLETDSLYGNDLALVFNQPLLRGAGIETNTHYIRIAKYGSQIAQARTKLEVILVLAAVDRVYWRLYATRRELEVRKQEYDLAVSQMERAQRMVDAEKAAEIEVTRAEAAVAERLEAIIVAENLVRDRQRDLKRILNKAGLDLDSRTIVIPSTLPNPRHYQLDEQRLMRYALEHRMELLELELQVAQNESAIQFARNGTLPLLSASYTYNINGLGPTLGKSYDLLLRNRFVDHRIGLVFQMPLGNQAAESRLRAAILTKLQNLATLDMRERLIRQEVLNAADQLEANWQRVLASRKSAISAQRTMEAEQRHFELGLQNSTEVLDAQTKYADAQSRAIRAEVEYQISQVDLAYATGSLLGAARVEWKSYDELADSE